MQVEIFTLCDAAAVCTEELNILGTFDRLSFAKFPNESGAFAIATKVRCEPEEIGAHSMHVRWIDPDGGTVDDSDVCQFKVNFLEKRDIWHHIWRYDHKEFFGENEYVLQLIVYDVPLASVPLTVVLK